MALIALCVWTMPGEINGTLKLARTWTGAGHRVVYVGVADARQNVERNGFPFIAVLEAQLPAGTFENRDDVRQQRMRRLRRVGVAVRRKHKFEALLTQLVNDRLNEVERTFINLRPDLAILCTHTPHPAMLGLLGARQSVRCAYLTQQMVHSTEPNDIRPAPGRATWRRLYRRMRPYPLTVNYPKFQAALLDSSGLPPQRCDYDDRMYPLRAPVLYPWPTPFDLPRSREPNVLPIEAGVDLDRQEESPFAFVPARSPLVYCSFGTMLPLGLEAARKLLQTAIDSMRLLPDVAMVVAVGPFFQASDFSAVPPNVCVYRHVRQVEILRRADVMVTHGGSSGTRECLQLGVPMIIIPQAFESSEYARRVAFHRLGVAVDAERLSAHELSDTIRTVLDDPRYKQAAVRMKQTFDDWERRAPSLQALEVCLTLPREVALRSPWEWSARSLDKAFVRIGGIG